MIRDSTEATSVEERLTRRIEKLDAHLRTLDEMEQRLDEAKRLLEQQSGRDFPTPPADRVTVTHSLALR